ncbi:MAG: MFS transporter [Simkaniaceae bacterium]
MKSLIHSVFPPILSLIIVMLGNSFFTTFISVSLSEQHSTYIVGFVNSAFYSGILIGCFFMERLIHRVGHVRSFTFFASLNAILVLLHLFLINIYAWVSLRFLMGICSSGFFIIIESWLLLLSDTNSRGKILSFYMLALYLAQGASQFILNWLNFHSHIPFCVTVMFSCLSIIPFSIMNDKVPKCLTAPNFSIFEIIKNSPLGFTGCILSGMMVSAFHGLAPVMGKELGLNMLQITKMMGLTIFGGLIFQWPIGHLSDLFNRRKVLSFVSLSLIAVSVTLAFSRTFHFGLFLPLSMLFGGLLFTLYPLSISYTSDRISTASITTITCVMLILYGVGSIAGPLAVPLALTHIGPHGLYLYVATLTIFLFLFSNSRFGREEILKTPLSPPEPLAVPSEELTENQSENSLN